MVSKVKIKQSVGNGTGNAKAGCCLFSQVKTAGSLQFNQRLMNYLAYIQEKKRPWLDELGHSLARKGLRIKAVAADGNCFFRACCDQMQVGYVLLLLAETS